MYVQELRLGQLGKALLAFGACLHLHEGGVLLIAVSFVYEELHVGPVPAYRQNTIDVNIYLFKDL